ISAAVNRFASEPSGAAAAPRFSKQTISNAATGLDARAAFDFMRLFFRNLRKGKAESIRIQSSKFKVPRLHCHSGAVAPKLRAKAEKFKVPSIPPPLPQLPPVQIPPSFRVQGSVLSAQSSSSSSSSRPFVQSLALIRVMNPEFRVQSSPPPLSF